ncbi:MAG: hypothetical protein ACXW32_13360 [Limisphaerales bacterium]
MRKIGYWEVRLADLLEFFVEFENKEKEVVDGVAPEKDIVPLSAKACCEFINST